MSRPAVPALSQNGAVVTYPYMRNLTALQRHVVFTLANRGDATPADWTAWYPLTTEQARGVIDRLYVKGIVEPIRFEGRSRVFTLTDAGWELARSLTEDDEMEAVS